MKILRALPSCDLSDALICFCFETPCFSPTLTALPGVLSRTMTVWSAWIVRPRLSMKAVFSLTDQGRNKYHLGPWREERRRPYHKAPHIQDSYCSSNYPSSHCIYSYFYIGKHSNIKINVAMLRHLGSLGHTLIWFTWAPLDALGWLGLSWIHLDSTRTHWDWLGLIWTQSDFIIRSAIIREMIADLQPFRG